VLIVALGALWVSRPGTEPQSEGPLGRIRSEATLTTRTGLRMPRAVAAAGEQGAEQGAEQVLEQDVVAPGNPVPELLPSAETQASAGKLLPADDESSGHLLDQIQDPVATGPTPASSGSDIWRPYPGFGPSTTVGPPRHFCEPIEPVEIRIVALSRGTPRTSPVVASINDPVELHAVLKARVGDGMVVFGSAAAVDAAGYDASLPRWSWHDHHMEHVTWFKIEPTAYNASNTDPSWHWHEIPYVRTPFREDRSSILADAIPTNYNGNPRGYGTMRFQVTFRSERGEVSTPGPDRMNPHQPTREIFEISFRGASGVPVVDHAVACFNVPYIWGSASRTQRDPEHQSEWRYGADCADLVSYAARHAGYDVSYAWTGEYKSNRQWTRRIAGGVQLAGNAYIRDGGNPIPFGTGGVERGDLILWDGHIGILARDTPPLGQFDATDEVIHTLFAPPRSEAVSTAFEGTFEVLRLNSSLHAE